MSNKQKGKYVFSTEFSPKRVNGVNYTFNESDVIITFFEELPNYPESFEVKISDDGTVAQEDSNNDYDLIRNIQARLIMKKDEAIMLMNYLKKSVEGDFYDDNQK